CPSRWRPMHGPRTNGSFRIWVSRASSFLSHATRTSSTTSTARNWAPWTSTVCARSLTWPCLILRRRAAVQHDADINQDEFARHVLAWQISAFRDDTLDIPNMLEMAGRLSPTPQVFGKILSA